MSKSKDLHHISRSEGHCYTQQLRDCYPQRLSCCTHQGIKGTAFQSIAQNLLCTGISPSLLSTGQRTCTTYINPRSLANSAHPPSACQGNFVMWCMSGTAMPINWSGTWTTCSSSSGTAIPRVQPAVSTSRSKNLHYMQQLRNISTSKNLQYEQKELRFTAHGPLWRSMDHTTCTTCNKICDS